MNEQKELPLCSLAIITYNHEKFIVETLRAAFAQTYPNLEIIVSDDASTDNSWLLIQKEVAQYTGPHRVILNRNPTNLGRGWNSRKALALTTGEVIVWNDGDDISLPNRVQLTYDAFRDQGPETMLIWCNHEPIDETGKSLGEFKNFERDVRKKTRDLSDIKHRIRIPFGAILAWRRDIEDMFHELPLTLFAQDNVIVFRALLLGKVGFVRDVLVRYRSHNASFSNEAKRGDYAETCRLRADSRDNWNIQALGQHLVDMQYLGKKFPQRRQEFSRVGFVVQKEIRRWLVSYSLLSNFPRFSLRDLWRTVPYPEFYRHFVCAILYRLGLYGRRKK